MLITTEKRHCRGCGYTFSVVAWMLWRVEGWCKVCAPHDLLKRDSNVPAPIRPQRELKFLDS